jgi:Uma2 family endonuclease
MAMPIPVTALGPGEWTAELVRQLPEDDKRYEVIDGELLVSPAPGGRHQRACYVLCKTLDEFAFPHGIGVAMLAPTDIEYSPRRMVQPDVFVVSLEEAKVACDWDRVPQLLLVAEVLSLSTAVFDRRTKRRMYLDQGVPEYWIVDLHARVIERWTPTSDRPSIHDEVIEWRPFSHAPTLRIELAAYFAAALDIFPDREGW